MSLADDKQKLKTEINRYKTLVSNLSNPNIDYLNNLDYIKGCALRYGDASLTRVARDRGRSLGTVDCLRQYPCRTGFTGSPRTCEKVGVNHPSRGKGVSQGRGDMSLANNLLEGLRSPFSI